MESAASGRGWKAIGDPILSKGALMTTAHNCSPPPRPGLRGRLPALLAALLLLSACGPGAKSEEELRKEIQGLKAEVTAMKEKLDQVQAGQQAMLDLLKKPGLPMEPMAAPGQPPAAEMLSVGQLLEGKERYLGARVTVKGQVGPVMVHHKSLLLKSPQGMVEVLFGQLPDPKLVQSLTSITIDRPLTVTGVVSLPPPKGGGAKLQITAEAVEF